MENNSKAFSALPSLWLQEHVDIALNWLQSTELMNLWAYRAWCLAVVLNSTYFNLNSLWKHVSSFALIIFDSPDLYPHFASSLFSYCISPFLGFPPFLPHFPHPVPPPLPPHFSMILSLIGLGSKETARRSCSVYVVETWVAVIMPESISNQIRNLALIRSEVWGVRGPFTLFSVLSIPFPSPPFSSLSI